MAGAGLCASFEAWKCDSRGRRRAQGIVRLGGVTKVTFRGRRSTLCALDVNVAVTLGLACERMLFGGAGIAKLLGRAA